MHLFHDIQSSEAALLQKARGVAETFAHNLINEEIAGIVFLGAIVRGYFDASADIDLGIFTKPGSTFKLDGQFFHAEGLEIQCWLGELENERQKNWDMAKRWTYAQGQVFYDPSGAVAQLLQEKVPLQAHERKWLMMSGLVLSEWYINRLSQLWVARGNLVSAQHMFHQGLTYFFDMLFGLNDQLVPDEKWRYYCAEKLQILPSDFRQRFQEVLLLHALTTGELERRRQAFMSMLTELQPLVEAEVQLTFDEIEQIV